jgi:hypothetical protein
LQSGLVDTGDVMTQMINTSSKTLEDELKTYTDRAKSKTQEVEARTRRREQSCSRSSETKRRMNWNCLMILDLIKLT